MSLAEAVLEVAEQMETTDVKDEAARVYFSVFAKMLRTAVKAVEGQQVFQGNLGPFGGTDLFMSPEAQREHFVAIEREKIRKAKQASDAEEGPLLGEAMREVVNGPAKNGDEPTFVSTPPGGRVGDRTILADSVYFLASDGKLHYHEESTKELKTLRMASKGG